MLLEHTSSEWPALLAGICDGDPELEQELRSLLGRGSAIRGFLEHPPLVHVDKAGKRPDPGAELEGRQLGQYRVVREIARGGMGWVYLAEDTDLGRRVALKVLPPEMAGDAGRLARFQREARIVHVVGRSLRANFGTRLRIGELTSLHPFFPDSPGLSDARNAEVHVVLQDHGELVPSEMPAQIKVFEGGCEASERECGDVQFAMFK